MATKQRGLTDEINDVVLGPFSPRRGSDYLLQPPRPPPEVTGRTLVQTGQNRVRAPPLGEQGEGVVEPLHKQHQPVK